jgi:hypothetical protein
MMRGMELLVAGARSGIQGQNLFDIFPSELSNIRQEVRG